MRKEIFIYLSIILLINIIEIDCHGRLLVPPARSSAWREDPQRFPIIYDDAQMFCGGFLTQWGKNKGRCGICGEDYSAPKKLEKGGSMYRGYTVRTYGQGDLIDVEVEITANHKGYYEFRLCDVNQANNNGEATQECLNENILKDKFGRVKIPALPGNKKFKITLKLPDGLSCEHCVFQWKYNSGNSWNTDPVTKESCIGCGPQENFYGCSDIEIKPKPKRELIGDESTMVSNEMLKRLLSELKRLKKIEHKQEEKDEKKEIRELLIEPLHQDVNEDDERQYKNMNEKRRQMLIEPLFQEQDEDKREESKILVIEPDEPENIVVNSKRVLLISPYNPNTEFYRRSQTGLLSEPYNPDKQEVETNLKYLKINNK